ncbi:MAG: RNA polymerase sigma factor [Gemmatimonadota bacterium]
MLYRRHVARVHGLARRMIGPDEADDVTQDVFVRAWRKLDSFRGDAAFGTWLHRVAINAILRRRTRLGRRREREVTSDDPFRGASTRRARPDLRIDLDEAIGRLPVGAREVFVLYDIEGYKHREIAALLGITQGTSKSQLHRARMLLRERLTG